MRRWPQSLGKVEIALSLFVGGRLRVIPQKAANPRVTAKPAAALALSKLLKLGSLAFGRRRGNMSEEATKVHGFAWGGGAERP